MPPAMSLAFALMLWQAGVLEDITLDYSDSNGDNNNNNNEDDDDNNEEPTTGYISQDEYKL